MARRSKLRARPSVVPTASRRPSPLKASETTWPAPVSTLASKVAAAAPPGDVPQPHPAVLGAGGELVADTGQTRALAAALRVEQPILHGRGEQPTVVDARQGLEAPTDGRQRRARPGILSTDRGANPCSSALSVGPYRTFSDRQVRSQHRVPPASARNSAR